MSRPRKNKAERIDRPLLSEQALFRAIKKHAMVAQYDLTYEEVRAVFLAFADITYQCLLNKIRVNLPKLGEFYSQPMKGYKGGKCRIPSEPFKKGSGVKEIIVAPKPDYEIMQFEFKKNIKYKFKKETQEDFVRNE